MSQRLIIIRGIPGSGKSTYAKKLKRELFEQNKSCTHFEADMFFMKDGKYNWNPKLIGLAHKWCYESVFNSFDKGTEIVIVSNTFVTLKEMANYIDTAKQRNIPVTVYRMNNEFKNEHSVPDDVITKMKTNFVDYENEIITNG